MVISKQLCHIYFKKWDNEPHYNYAFFNPKRYENYLKTLSFRVYNVFFEKSKYFPDKKA
jgi:hypothetical protein